MKEHFPAYLKKVADKYKYVLLLGLAGILLMVWPVEGAEDQTAKSTEAQPEAHVLLEEALEQLLSQMEGVGNVQVLLTVEQGSEAVYAYDRSDSRTDGGGSLQTELVTLSQNGGQVPVEVQTTAPVYRGAAVVCEGGGSPSVCLLVTQMIQSLTGLPADRIVITKMK